MKTKQKFCWVARQTKDGWRLKASIGPRDYPLRGLILASTDQVKRLLGGNIVFVEKAKK